MSASHPIGGFKPYSVDKPQPLRPLEEIRADILALERETEGLLAEIIDGLRLLPEARHDARGK